MDTQTGIDLAVFFGSFAGAAAATLIPFWAKIKEDVALGNAPRIFDKKYLGTFAFAIIVGIIAAFMSFDQSVASVDPHSTLVKIFIVSAFAAATSNVTLNRILSTSAIQSLFSENQKLKQQIQQKFNSDGKPI